MDPGVLQGEDNQSDLIGHVDPGQPLGAWKYWPAKPAPELGYLLRQSALGLPLAKGIDGLPCEVHDPIRAVDLFPPGATLQGLPGNICQGAGHLPARGFGVTREHDHGVPTPLQLAAESTADQACRTGHNHAFRVFHRTPFLSWSTAGRDIWYDEHGGIPHREGDGDEFPRLRPRPSAHLILNNALSNQLVKLRREELLSVPVPLPVDL